MKLIVGLGNPEGKYKNLISHLKVDAKYCAFSR